MNGLQLLAQIKRTLPFASIVLITGHGGMSTGVRAMREGAADCLQKPIDDLILLQPRISRCIFDPRQTDKSWSKTITVGLCLLATADESPANRKVETLTDE